MKSFSFGLYAEYFVVFLYSIKFYRILHHRRKTCVGEIDLIAVRGNQLVFIEVKARKDGLREGIVSKNQQNRIRRAAEYFIGKNTRFTNFNVRFDLVVVIPYKLPIIIKNAW